MDGRRRLLPDDDGGGLVSRVASARGSEDGGTRSVADLWSGR